VVVRRFLGDLHVVHMASRMPAEVISTNSARPHLVDAGAADIAHGGAQAAHQLVDHRTTAPCRARGLRCLRAPACRRWRRNPGSSGRRRPASSRRGAHAAVGSCRSGPGTARSRPAPLRCRRTGRPSSRRTGAGGDGLGDVARIADAAVGDQRHAAAGLSALATLSTAVICGTPTPATMRVVQIEPGPMPTLTPSAPASTSASAARRWRCCRRSRRPAGSSS
jgi:hypothetical protein